MVRPVRILRRRMLLMPRMKAVLAASRRLKSARPEDPGRCCRRWISSWNRERIMEMTIIDSVSVMNARRMIGAALVMANAGWTWLRMKKATRKMPKKPPI